MVSTNSSLDFLVQGISSYLISQGLSFLTSQMAHANSTYASLVDSLVPCTEYRIMHARKIVSETSTERLLALHTADHSLFCIFPTDLGTMLTDLQINHVNNRTRILTAVYIGRNPYGEHVFQIRDPTMPTPTQVHMVALWVSRCNKGSSSLSGFIFSLFTQQQNTCSDFL
jgi:hypothetical protein